MILVMGHGGCGAVKATIQAKEVPGQISALFPHIQPAVDQAGSNLEAATKANARIQAGLLRDSSTVISGLVKESKLKVASGVSRPRKRSRDAIGLGRPERRRA